MRLIDADKLIDDFKNELEKVDFEKLSDNDKLIISTSAIALKDFVKRQPIAYNTDKVVEELEERRANHDCKICKYYVDGNTTCEHDCADALIDDLIEIVKAGGVDEMEK